MGGSPRVLDEPKVGLFTSAFARTEFQAVRFMPVFVFAQILIGAVTVAALVLASFTLRRRTP